MGEWRQQERRVKKVDRRAETVGKESGERWTRNGDSRKGGWRKVDRRVKTAGKEIGERWTGERRQKESVEKVDCRAETEGRKMKTGEKKWRQEERRVEKGR